MSHEAYNFRWMPKLVFNDGFDYGRDLILATIVDDPDVLKKCASSKVVMDWGDIQAMPGHTIVHLIANGATEFTGANRNGDGFKAAFCQETHPTFAKFGALYRHHINKDYSKRDGDIIRTAYNDEMGRNELAVAASHDKCADWLSRLERGEKVAFSMGFDCKYDVCSICGNKAKTRKDYCHHVGKHASYPYGMNRVLDDGRRCFVDNPEGVWNDISFVGTGADMIAQNLRKIAGLDDHEIIGGADLAAAVLGSAADHASKLAIATKLSRMEKQVPAIAYKERSTTRITQKVAGLLRSAQPSRMFNELARNGAVLGLRDFFKLAVGDLYTDDFDAVVRDVEPHAQGLFSSICQNPAWLEEVCSNCRYDADKTASPILSDYDATEIVLNFSIAPEISGIRLINQALVGEESRGLRKVSADEQTVRELLSEWAAYKLAALDAMPMELGDEAMAAAALAL